jgi:GT2 family glycosyltransferase
MKSCAIVILNYNGVEMLKTFLFSVISCSTYEIIVIDNASTDESVDFLNRKYPELQIIQLLENFGYAGGYNWGLEQLKGKFEYYILLNSDVKVTPSWDIDLISWMHQHQSYAALQPKILSYQDPSKFDYAGAGGGFLDQFGYPHCRGRILDTIEEDRGQYDDAIDVDWASGACMVVKSTDFHELSGFDAHFFAHMEEIDLCWRMRRMGKKIGYLGQVSVYHLGGATLDRASPRKLELNIRNSLYMLYKMQMGLSFFLILFVKFMLESTAGISYWVGGKKEQAKAIWRGYQKFWITRHLISKFNTPTSGDDEILSRSKVKFLFWNYYLLGRKRFSEL